MDARGTARLLDKVKNLHFCNNSKIGAQFERGLERLEEAATNGGV